MMNGSRGWRDWTPGMGSLFSECIFFLPNGLYSDGPKEAVRQLLPALCSHVSVQREHRAQSPGHLCYYSQLLARQ